MIDRPVRAARRPDHRRPFCIPARGEGLEHMMEIEAGDLICIPANVPHLPFDDPDAPACAVVARDPPHEQESVVLLPHLDPLVHA